MGMYKQALQHVRRYAKITKTASDESFTLQPGQTLSHVVKAHNTQYPDNPITVQQLVQANGGLDPTKYQAGKQYKMPPQSTPAVQPPSATPTAASYNTESSLVARIREKLNTLPVQNIAMVAPDSKAATPAEPDHSIWTNWLWREQSHPARIFINDLVTANINRLARGLGLPEDKSLIQGSTITSMDNDKLDWLRMAIQAKGQGAVSPTGSFGGRRRVVGRMTDDYQTFVHPGFAYSKLPSTGTSTVNNLWWRSKGVPNQIEHTLGDFSWTTDNNGNIIVRDTYDFNDTEGRKNNTPYGGFRRFAGDWASKSTDPDAQKTKFEINLGNPNTWGEYDEAKFHAFNEPYREKFPGLYRYNQ